MRMRMWILPLLLAGIVGCSDVASVEPGVEGGSRTAAGLPGDCALDESFLADGNVGRDGIPALTDPPMATPDRPEAFSYLQPDDRAVGFLVEGRPYAVPHNILWWHEIVNLNLGERQLAVTLCPLTGTSLGFDRTSIDGQELGVSGLLFKANLVMYNRGEPESLWPQMMGEARCGADVGQDLARHPVVEMTWEGWKELHPNTSAVTSATGHTRPYQENPYRGHDDADNPGFLGFPMPELDGRRPPKERVIGVPPTHPGRAVAFPFGELAELDGPFAAVEFAWEGEPAVVLWSDAARGGMVYRLRTEDGRSVELTVADGAIRDRATGTRWEVDGRATEGELSGARLVPVAAAYTAFWASWAAFFPATELWEG